MMRKVWNDLLRPLRDKNSPFYTQNNILLKSVPDTGPNRFDAKLSKSRHIDALDLEAFIPKLEHI
jgi:hypothetical protein